MKDYKAIERGDFKDKDFNIHINKAILIISNFNNLTNDNFKEIRRSSNKIFPIDGIDVLGTYLTYEIRKDNKYLRELNCFIDNKKTYIEISTTF